jgi:hypothetical protein
MIVIEVVVKVEELSISGVELYIYSLPPLNHLHGIVASILAWHIYQYTWLAYWSVSIVGT